MATPFTTALQRLSTDRYRESVSNLGKTEQSMFRADPQMNYERLLRNLGLSNADEAALRGAFTSIYDRYNNAFTDMYGPWELGELTGSWEENFPMFWDYLADFNFNHELARLGQGARYRNPARFQRPARWIAF